MWLVLSIGVMGLVNRDLAWKQTQSGLRSRGIPQSERTPEWETMNLVRSVMFILAGLVLVVLAFVGF